MTTHDVIRIIDRLFRRNERNATPRRTFFSRLNAVTATARNFLLHIESVKDLYDVTECGAYDVYNCSIIGSNAKNERPVALSYLMCPVPYL